MGKLIDCQFNNNRSVRFNLDSFALPVTVTKKKNTIYTNYLCRLQATKRQLKPELELLSTHGYDHAAYWGNLVFTADQDGLYYADRNRLDFEMLDGTLCPRKLCIANNRLFMIAMNRQRLVYTADLQSNWTPTTLVAGVIQLPENYGLCLDLQFYRNNLLVICENGLLSVNKSLALRHLSDDSELLKISYDATTTPFWESDWFSLGYATDTQTLREVFLKTNLPLTMVVASNRSQRTVHVAAADRVQKIKVNLNGDQFKITLIVVGSEFCVSDLAAIVAYGKRR